MPGRNAKPIAIHIAEGNPNRLTKKQIRDRQAAEIKLGTEKPKLLKVPNYVKSDEVAHNCWKDLIKEYKNASEQGVDLLTSSDVDLLAMYCKAYSDYQRLLEGDDETAVNKKMDMLIKMQDRLFLNPLAKIKNIPKQKKEEKPVSKFAKFGG